MNKAIIMWHLTADVETKPVWETEVANICIATTEKWKDSNWDEKERTTFHNCTLWGQSAKFARQYAKKGDLVLAEGKINTDSWEDEDTWKTRYSTKIVVSIFNILRSKLSKDDSETSPKSDEYDEFDDLPF